MLTTYHLATDNESRKPHGRQFGQPKSLSLLEKKNRQGKKATETSPFNQSVRGRQGVGRETMQKSNSKGLINSDSQNKGVDLGSKTMMKIQQALDDDLQLPSPFKRSFGHHESNASILDQLNSI